MLPQAILLIEDESDRKYAEKLYAEHRHVMYVVAYSMLHNVSDTQDAIAQIMLNILPRSNDIKTLERYKLRAHIISTVKNVALTILARRKRERQLPYDDDETGYTETASAEDANLSGIADADALARALAKLPERERQALYMKYSAEWTDAEIAQALNVRPDSVRVILSRARQHARAILESEGTYSE